MSQLLGKTYETIRNGYKLQLGGSFYHTEVRSNSSLQPQVMQYVCNRTLASVHNTIRCQVRLTM